MNVINLSNLNLSIVGLGLIGGSIAKAISKNLKFKNLWAVDVDINILNEAKNSGVIDQGYTDPKFPLENSDIVILCIYPNITLDFLTNNMKYFKHNSIITDTAGIKNKIVTEMRSIMRDDIEFIGGHPMSGKESSGYHFSDDNIFNGAQYILTPVKSTSENSINILKEIITGMGFKKVTLMSPEIHDETVAFTSQLPHIIASCLINNTKLENSINCIGGSFKDVTRVAEINYDLWSELIHENKNNILNELDNFIKDINNIYDIINNGDSECLKSFFIKSCQRRKEMNT